MSTYVVAHYRVTNPDAFQKYPPVAVPTITAHGGELLVADFASETIEGQPPHVTVVLRFASKDAAHAWYQSADYQAIKHLRLDNSAEGTVVFADGVAPPQ